MAIINAWLYKGVNFIIGKTMIFIIIFAWFLIITGGLMLLWPERDRKKISAIGFQQIKFVLFVVIFFAVTKLLALGDSLGLQLVVSGFIGIICLYLFLKAIMQRKVDAWMAKAPVFVLRGFAALQILIGILMLAFQKRIW